MRPSDQRFGVQSEVIATVEALIPQMGNAYVFSRSAEGMSPSFLSLLAMVHQG